MYCPENPVRAIATSGFLPGLSLSLRTSSTPSPGSPGSTWTRAARASTRYWSSPSTSISSAAPSRRWCRRSTTATAEDRRDRPAEIREIDRLDEVGGEAPRLHSRKIVREGGDRDHGYRAALLGRQVAEPVHEVGARSVGQHEIGHDDVRRVRLERRTRLGDRRNGNRVGATELQDGLHRVAKIAVVLDQERRNPAQVG